MQNTACISGADYREFLDLVVKPGKRKRRAYVAGIVLVVVSVGIVFGLTSFAGALWVAFSRGGLGDFMLRPALLIPTLIALCLVPLAFRLLWRTGRLVRENQAAAKDPLDETALREGLNIGEMLFAIDVEGVRVSSALFDETYSWDAFRGLEESERNFFLMIDQGSALIIPKQAFVGSEGLEAGRAVLVARIRRQE